MLLENMSSEMLLLRVGADGVIREARGDWAGAAGVQAESLRGWKLEEILKQSGAGGSAELLCGPKRRRVSARELEGDEGRYILIADFDRQARLAEALRLLAQAAIVGRMAGNVAHEFNNIFSAIVGYVELAQTSGKAERVQKALDVTDKSISRAAGLSRALLLAGRRIGAGPEAYSPATAVEESLLLAHKGLEKMELRVDFSAEVVPEGLFEVGAIQFAFLELLDNAKRFAGDGGKIAVRVLYEKARDFVFIVVVDSGPGVSAEVRAKIFEPFFTGPADPAPGLGLGLALALDAVRRNGGTIEAGRDGEGRSVFTLAFPLRSAEARQAMKT